MNEYTFDEIEVGMSASFKKLITKEMEDSFRVITGDENPLHKDDEFASVVSGGRFKCHVVFGMLTASFYSTVAGLYLPGKYSLIHSFDEISCMKPVFIGDELTVNAEVIDKDEALKMIRLQVIIENQENKKVSKAKMKILVTK